VLATFNWAGVFKALFMLLFTAYPGVLQMVLPRRGGVKARRIPAHHDVDDMLLLQGVAVPTPAAVHAPGSDGCVAQAMPSMGANPLAASVARDHTGALPCYSPEVYATNP
jgi:hypothetical protein